MLLHWKRGEQLLSLKLNLLVCVYVAHCRIENDLRDSFPNDVFIEVHYSTRWRSLHCKSLMRVIAPSLLGVVQIALCLMEYKMELRRLLRSRIYIPSHTLTPRPANEIAAFQWSNKGHQVNKRGGAWRCDLTRNTNMQESTWNKLLVKSAETWLDKAGLIAVNELRMKRIELVCAAPTEPCAELGPRNVR